MIFLVISQHQTIKEHEYDYGCYFVDKVMIIVLLPTLHLHSTISSSSHPSDSDIRTVKNVKAAHTSSHNISFCSTFLRISVGSCLIFLMNKSC